MSTSYIFLAGALFLFVIAIVILFMGKGKKDDKKVDKEFDENYAVNINEVYLRTGDVRETLVQMQDSYEDYNPLMSGLLGKAITYLDGDYGDYETALDMINVNHDETVDKVHKDIICMAVSKKKGLPADARFPGITGSGKEIFMKKNNRLLIVVFAVLALIIGVLKGVDYYRYTKVSKERVSSIQAEFVGETAPSQELSMSMFDVTVYTETGSVYSARSFDIDEKKAPAHGDSFDTKIEYHGSTTTVTVPITRSKVVQYKVGYPTKENVLATIYNNGDLEFTGSGNTMNFANGDTPWADEDYTYVIFKDEITPTNVDYWFEGNTALTGCETLPKSIESARGTFQGCENLKKTPSFFQCSSLKIITDCFSGCTSLEQSDPLPVSVMEADGAFEDCIKLTKAPDMTKTNALSSINAIFKGCMSLVDAPVIPDSVLDMSEAFLGDSNIYTASAFPESVEDISSAYADCISLEKAASIPASVINCDSCYSGCSNLYGELSINTNTEDCANLLSNAVTSGKTLKLKGKSGRLFEIQQDSGSRYVTIKDTEKAEKNAKKLERQNNQ